jgi:hypothetical protein
MRTPREVNFCWLRLEAATFCFIHVLGSKIHDSSRYLFGLTSQMARTLQLFFSFKFYPSVTWSRRDNKNKH